MTTSNGETLSAFLERLGSMEPTPGGGAASALAGAVAAALTEMVAQLTAGKPKFQAVEAEAREVIERARSLRAALVALMDADAAAYAAVAQAYRLPRASDAERAYRTAEIQRALSGAMRPPLEMMERGCDTLELAERIATIGNPSVASDAGCAAILGEAAVRAAGLNVLANVVLLTDTSEAAGGRARVAELEARAAALRERAMAVVRERMRL